MQLALRAGAQARGGQAQIGLAGGAVGALQVQPGGAGQLGIVGAQAQLVEVEAGLDPTLLAFSSSA